MCVGVAQSVERRIVVPNVEGSKPFIHLVIYKLTFI